MKTQTKESVAPSMQIVCFNVGKEEYGIEILKVQEILKLPEVTPLPKSAEYILGVIDLRGKVIPIIDLGVRFGISEKSAQNKRAIVVDIKRKRIGLAIDQVSHVVKLEQKDIEPPIVKGISGRFIIGIGKVENKFVIILDIDRIFSADELTSL